MQSFSSACQKIFKLHRAKLGDLLGEVWDSEAKGFEKNQDDAVEVVGAAVVSNDVNSNTRPSDVALNANGNSLTTLLAESFKSEIRLVSFKIYDGSLPLEDWKICPSLFCLDMSTLLEMFQYAAVSNIKHGAKYSP